MHFCKKCGNKSKKTSKRCSTCGSELEQMHKDDIAGILDRGNDLHNDNHILKHKEEPLEIIKKLSLNKKIRANKFFAIAILILVILGTLLIKNPIKNFFIRNNTGNWLVYAVDKYKGFDTVDTVSEFKIKSKIQPQDPMEYTYIENIIEQCTLRVNSKADRKTKERYSKVSLIHKKDNVLNGEIYTNKEYLVISMPELYKDAIYIKWQDMNKLITNKEKNNDSKSIDLKNYENALNMKKSKYYDKVNKDYKEFFYKVMDDYITRGDTVKVNIDNKENTVKCDEILLHLDNEGIIKVFNSLIEKLSKDENLKILVKERVFEFLTTAENKGELNKLNLTKEDVDKIKKEFDSEYNSFISELIYIQKADKKALDGKINSLTKVRVDSKNYIRGFRSEVSIEKKKTSFNLISDTVVNSINSKLYIKKISKEGSKDISELPPYERANIVKDIRSNIGKILIQKLNIE